MSQLANRKGKKRRNNSRGKRRQGAADRFAALYQKAENFRRKNERLRDKVANVYTLFEREVSEHEVAMSAAIYAETENLLRFLSKKSLAQWQRAELAEWIMDNLDMLMHNPFTQGLDLEALTREFARIGDLYFSPSDGGRAEDSRSGTEEKRADNVQDNADDPQEDMFGFDGQEVPPFEQEVPPFEDEPAMDDAFAEFERLFEEAMEAEGWGEGAGPWDEQAAAQQKEIDKLFKTTSLRKMFRQLARALHPDLEQDEAKKHEKQVQMKALLEARENNDILTLFTLHRKHVGNAPQDLDEQELDRLNLLLDQQVRRLKEEQQDIIFDNPLHGAIYEQFNAPNDKQIKAGMRRYKKQLQERIDATHELRRELTSLKKLKPILEERYELNRFAELEPFVFDGL